MRVDKRLSSDELDELGQFLASEAAPDDCMDLAMVDGFLTAVAIGPALVPPTEWLPMVWGPQGEEPAFESLEQADRIPGLLMRLHNQHIRTLNEAPEKFAPLFCEWERNGKHYLSAEEWCLGFGLGVALREKDWRPLIEDKEAVNLLAPMMWLSSEEARKEMGGGGDPEATYSEMVDLLTISVLAIYAYWEPYRRKMWAEELERESPAIDRRPRVGRNEPCPCGSGKKFKKCCGAARA
jgi:uncharacterized protein